MLSSIILPLPLGNLRSGMPHSPVPQGFSSMLHSRGSGALPSDVSPVALDMSLSGLNLGLQCVEDIEELPLYSSLLDCRCQTWSSASGLHVLDVVPIGIMESILKSSSGSA